MLGATSITAILGGAPPADSDTARLKSFAKTAVDAGLALLLIAPGSKVPVDLRSAVQKRKDDEAAREAARAAGRKDWVRARSLAGSHLATTDPKLITRYIDAYRKTYGSDVAVNFAVELGASKLVVVDCDTADQVTAFLSDAGVPADTPLPPTVATPGATDADGKWVHSNGGHFYFTLDELEDPESLTAIGGGTFTAAGGYAVMWRNRYVLIPPSVRPEGTYTLAGREYGIPDWLVDAITTRAVTRRERDHSSESSGEMTEAVDAWSRSVTWADILAPLGWTLTARTDRCGCAVWTAPGDHGSPKSATTHDTSCELGRYTVGNAPMHIWTDNPGPGFEEWVARTGSKTLSKLQAVAVVNYKGDVGTACADLGVLPAKDSLALEVGVDPRNSDREEGVDKSAMDGDITLAQPEQPDESEQMIGEKSEPDPHQDCQLPEHGGCQHGDSDCPVSGPPQPYKCNSCGVKSKPGTDDTFWTDADGEWMHSAEDELHEVYPEPFPDAGNTDADPEETDNGVLNHESTEVPDIAPFNHWRDMAPPEYAIDGLIEHQALSCVIGPPGVGKSTFAIDLACHLVTGQRWQGRKVVRQRVLYLPGEGLSGAVQRIRAWEQAHDKNVGTDLLLGNAIIQLAASKEAWSVVAGYILEHRVGMIVFDTFARMSLGLEENSATDVGRAIKRFDQIRKLTGAGVMVIHHTGKVGHSGRGSNALNGALDSELLILDGTYDAGDATGERLELFTTKQKNAPRIKHPIQLMLSAYDDSVILTGPTGVVGDPLDTVVVAPLLVPEPMVETSIRLLEFAERFPTQGATRSEFTIGVKPDEYTAARKNADRRWKQHVAEAVDLGLRYELLLTLTGTATGSRYVPGTTTPEAARIRAAAEAMAD